MVVVSPEVVAGGTGTGPTVETIRMTDVRHTYLHYLLDALALKNGGSFKRLTPLLDDVKMPRQSAADLLPIDSLPGELIGHYRELLRTYVIMGSGNLGDVLRHLAEMLVVAGLTAQQTLQLHLHVLEELLHGLGSRSTRHVMNRADLLALEVLLHVGDGYRRRYQERVNPPLQLTLPGFE